MGILYRIAPWHVTRATDKNYRRNRWFPSEQKRSPQIEAGGQGVEGVGTLIAPEGARLLSKRDNVEIVPSAASCETALRSGSNALRTEYVVRREIAESFPEFECPFPRPRPRDVDKPSPNLSIR